MRRYRTEITVPADRLVTLHIPDEFPEGRATITIEVGVEAAEGLNDGDDIETRHDIEWWDEFGGDEEVDELEVTGLSARLSSLGC